MRVSPSGWNGAGRPAGRTRSPRRLDVGPVRNYSQGTTAASGGRPSGARLSRLGERRLRRRCALGPQALDPEPPGIRYATLGTPGRPAALDQAQGFVDAAYVDGNETGLDINETSRSFVDNSRRANETRCMTKTYTLTVTDEQLTTLHLALANRVEAMREQCWREDPDDTRSTHNPACDCWYAHQAREADELARQLP